MVGPAGSPICIAYADVTLTWSKVKLTDLLKFRKLLFSTSISSAILACSWKLMVDYDCMGPSPQLFGIRFLNFCPSWGHVTSEFTNCWHHQNSLLFISTLAEARSLWLCLHVGRNKPCMLAVMTVSPLAGLSGSIPSQQIGLGNISTIVLSGTSGNQYCRFYCMGVLM